jgi:hypothetical protein
MQKPNPKARKGVCLSLKFIPVTTPEGPLVPQKTGSERSCSQTNFSENPAKLCPRLNYRFGAN